MKSPHLDPQADEFGIEEGRRFARRMYVPRAIGLGIGTICVGGGLWEVNAPLWVWALLAFNGLVWPHFAVRVALRSRNPYLAELRNLVLDSACGGAWVAAVHFSAAPSAVLIAMLAMDKVAVGGLRFLARCLAAQAVTALAVALLFGIPLEPNLSGQVARVGTVPLLVVYPIMVALTAHRLARRVRRQNEELRRLSATDGLTALPNHTSWMESVEREFARSRRYVQPASVLMLDLDYFKTVNDTHGHAVGDAVLRQVATVLRGLLRGQDVPGRYGGEEFGVLLPGTAARGARAIAERIRRDVEATRFDFNPALRITISIGIAEWQPADGESAEWIARADRALYRAKEEGRNRWHADAPVTRPAEPTRIPLPANPTGEPR